MTAVAIARARPAAAARLHAWLRDNGLTLVITLLFAVMLVGQALTGLRAFNDEQREHGEPTLTLPAYLASGHFLEATAENWESEFLQMAAYVLLTIGLFQKGSSESKKVGEREEVDRDPRQAKGKALAAAPWPVRRGGWILRLYENSLSLAFVLLFAVSFLLHAVGGRRLYNEEQLAHGGDPVSLLQFLGTSQFWFESLQNWQSEFLALVAMVWLSIWLRQRGSPESKPVDAPHAHTGSH